MHLPCSLHCAPFKFCLLQKWSLMALNDYLCLCFCSVAQLCLTLCHFMDWSTPGFPVCHHHPEFAQTHVHWASDAIQPSCLLLSSSILLLSIFPSFRVFSNDSALRIRWSSIGPSGSALVLPMNFQDWFPLGWTGQISLQSKGLSRVFSNTTDQKHQFIGAQPFLWCNSHPYITIGNTIALTIQTFVVKVISLLYFISTVGLPNCLMYFD